MIAALVWLCKCMAEIWGPEGGKRWPWEFGPVSKVARIWPMPCNNGSERGAKMAAQLRDLSLPTLILEGVNSPSAIAHNNTAIHRILPHARREVLPDAGHMGLLTHAPQVAALITNHCLKK